MSKTKNQIAKEFDKLIQNVMESDSIEYEDKADLLEGMKEEITCRINEINAIP